MTQNGQNRSCDTITLKRRNKALKSCQESARSLRCSAPVALERQETFLAHSNRPEDLEPENLGLEATAPEMGPDVKGHKHGHLFNNLF